MKKTALDKILESIDAKIAVLNAARAEVVAQRTKAPKPRVVKVDVEKIG